MFQIVGVVSFSQNQDDLAGLAQLCGYPTMLHFASHSASKLTLLLTVQGRGGMRGEG